MTNPNQPDNCVLGRGFTNPIYILPTPRDINMTTETQNPEFTEEQLQETTAAKGFNAFVYLSDLMQRYPMDLDAIRGGRIFVDATTDAKVRRKVVKGESQQNAIFEAYKTIDNNNVVKSTVEISNNAFTPSMLAATLAAKLMMDKDNGYNLLAYQFIQVAAALLQEGAKAEVAEDTKLNPTQDPKLTEYYDHLKFTHARAYAVTAISDLLKFAIGENPNLVSFADNMAYLNEVNDEVTGAGSREEGLQALNLVLTSITTLGFSHTFSDIIAMSEEMKQNVGEAALMELSGEEQK